MLLAGHYRNPLSVRLSVRLSVCAHDISITPANYGMKFSPYTTIVSSKAHDNFQGPGSKGTGVTGQSNLYAKGIEVRQSMTCVSVNNALSM